MSSYNVLKNQDEVFLRNLQLALIEYLNGKIFIKYRTNNGVTDYSVPFFLGSRSNDERFLQDYFLADVVHPEVINKYFEGETSPIPRGILEFKSATINPSEFSNRFVPANRTITDESTGLVKTIRQNVNILKMSVSCDINVKCNTLIEMYKVWQSFFENFYKTAHIEFQYAGIFVSASIGWSESAELANTYEFTFGDTIEKEITFSLEVETYLPVFDISTEASLNNLIESFVINFGTGKVKKELKQSLGQRKITEITNTNIAATPNININENVIKQ